MDATYTSSLTLMTIARHRSLVHKTTVNFHLKNQTMEIKGGEVNFKHKATCKKNTQTSNQR